MKNKHDYVVDVLQHTVLNLVNISIYSSSISSLHVFGAVSSPPTFLNLKEGGVDLSNLGGDLDLGLFWEPQGDTLP